MSKGLEALERLKNTLLAEGYWQDILQDVSIIEKELKEHEQNKAIEQELGIDLLTKNKIEKSHVVYRKGFDSCEEIEKHNRLGVCLDKYDLSGNQIFLPYNQYGKTWALTKEELEK